MLVDTVGTAEDVLSKDGGTRGDVDDGPSGDAFLIAAAIDVACVDIAAHQVDDGRHFVGIGQCLRRCLLHTYAAIGAGTEDCGFVELRHGLRNIDEDVAALLHDVAVEHVVASLTCAVDFVHVGQGVAADYGLEVDEGVAHAGLGEACLVRAVGIAVVAILGIRVVVVAVSAAEDVDDVACGVLNVGRCREHTGVGIRGSIVSIDLGEVLFVGGAHSCGEVAVGQCLQCVGCRWILLGASLAEYLSAEVVAAVDVVDDIGEGIEYLSVGSVAVAVDTFTYIGFGVTEDVGVT